MTDWHVIESAIAAATGTDFQIRNTASIGGGCINSAFRIEGDGRACFVKLNDADRLDMFEAEADGLREMAASGTVRVPRPVCHGIAGAQSFLAMEYLPLHGRGAQARLGAELAAMHRVTADRFGWHRDNTIGSTPQRNDRDDDWVRFYRDRRLGFQFELAAARGAGGALLRAGERLMADLPVFFESYSPRPSLLHGDLWSGNHAVTDAGEPVIFDPAVYYGDREADIAMTELFGGFSADFRAAYDDAWPLDDGYPARRTLYNLYHILNHYNLFGGGYLSQAGDMVDRLLAEVR